MSKSESKEMYLETIYLLEQEASHAHSADIAKRLGVSKPSVTKAMNVLKDNGLAVQEKYGPITLTPKGHILAEQIYENHKLITEFIELSLKLEHKHAEENACKIEHVINQEMLSAIKAYLKK